MASMPGSKEKVSFEWPRIGYSFSLQLNRWLVKKSDTAKLIRRETTAMALFDKGNYKAASAAFRSLLTKDPRDTTALFYFALCLYERKQFERCLKYWARLKKINPKQLNLHLNMGCASQNLGRDSQAIRYFKRELKLNQLSGETLYSLGTLYYNARKFKKAAPYLERCYRLRHSAEIIAGRLAYAYFKTKQLGKEIDLYDDFLKEHPKDTWALNNIGAALMQLAQYNRAQIYFRRASKIDPKNEMVLRNTKKARALSRRIN